MIKIIGSAMIVGSSLFCANSMAIKLSKRAKALKTFAQFCASAGESIRLFAAPVEQIVKGAAHEYAELEFLHLYPNVKPNGAFTKSDAKIIKAFLLGLGASDVCGQVKHCEAYAVQFERLASDAKAECEGKNKLYRVLGLFCGICIAVLLI